jgi:hypothetical protein
LGGCRTWCLVICLVIGEAIGTEWDVELEMSTGRGVGRQKIKRGAAEARTRQVYVFCEVTTKMLKMDIGQLLISEIYLVLKYGLS